MPGVPIVPPPTRSVPIPPSPSRGRWFPLVLLLLGAFGTLPCSAQENIEAAWVPVPAESLQTWTDAIERARAERNPRAERTALVGLATQLLDTVPDGGFPIGAGRWIGPGPYLQSAVAALEPADRERFVEELDLILRARLERSPTIDEIDRWLRDLPASSQFDPERARITAALLEAGRTETWLDRQALGWPPGVDLDARIVERWRPRDLAPDAPPLARPEHTIVRTHWPVAGDPRSPYSPGAVRVEPLVAGDALYFTNPDGVYAWDAAEGIERWFFPFVTDAPPILPGTVRRPALCGGTLVVTTERGIIGLDRDSGEIKFRHSGAALFSEETSAAATRDPEADRQNPILSVSPPATSERGAVLLVSRVQAGNLDLRVILVSPDGTIEFRRDVGSATGATHLALGAVLSAPVTRGDRIFLTTGRGSVISHSLIDGGLIWAAPYRAFSNNAHRDAIRSLDRPRDTRLERKGDLLLLTAHDSGSLHGISSRDGSVEFEIPLADHRFWAVGDAGESGIPLLLASPRALTRWTIEPTGVRGLSTRILDPGLPSITGRPLAVADGWWVPHQHGAYELSLTGELRAIVDFAPGNTVRALRPVGNHRLVSGDGFVELRQAIPPTPGSLSERWEEIARGVFDSIPESLPPPLLDGTPEARADEERIARTILWQLRRPGVSPELRRRVVPAAVERILNKSDRALRFLEEARRAFDRDERSLAVELTARALQIGDLTAPVEIAPLGEIPLEWAARHLLSLLRDDEEQLPDAVEWERRATLALRGGRGDRLEAQLEVFERLPGTTVGRRAALQAAEELYRYGNLGYSRDLLERLVLFEPRNAEAVEARLRLVELCRETGHPDRAREILAVLREDYGDLPLEVTDTAGTRTVTIRERCDSLEESLPEIAASRRDGVVDLPLLPAWRTRTELAHIRNLRVVPLPDGRRFLTIARRSLELRVAFDGERIWSRTLPPLDPEDGFPRWTSIGRLEEPLAITDRRLWLTDQRELLCLDVETGATVWSRKLPRIPDGEGGSVVDSIEETGQGDGTIIALGNSGRVYAYSADDGSPLWDREYERGLEGPIEVRSSLVLLGGRDPAEVAVWSITDGRTIWSEDLAARDDECTQEPWFAPPGSDEIDPEGDDVIVSLRSGSVRRIDVTSGEVTWELTTEQPLRRIHRVEDQRYWIAETIWSRETPMLIGFDPRTGSRLWQKSFVARKRGLHAIQSYDGDLYLVEGDYNQRRASCLEVPRAFPPPGPETEPRELKERWTEGLTQSWDKPRMRIHQDWILLEDPLNCHLTVLSREYGRAISPREGFESVLEFLAGRRHLYYAGFIDGTMVLFTRHGGMGLRAPDPLGDRARMWSRLEDLAAGGSIEVSSAPVADATYAYRQGQPDRAVQILEAAVDEPTLSAATRQAVHYRLEGFGEEVGEGGSDEWRVPRLEVPPTIDGSLEEAWNAATAWPLQTARYFHPIQGTPESQALWQGRRDLSVTLHSGWSEEGFHLALDVDDDSVQAFDRDLDYWNGDCLLLAFDFLGDGGSRAGSDDMLLTLALTVPNRQPPAPAPEEGGDAPEGDPPPDPEEEEDDQPEGDYSVLRKGDGSGVIYEVTLPWETVRTARDQEAIPHPGMIFRLNLVLTDDDTGRGASTYMSLSTGQMLREETNSVWNVFIPERFPRLILGR